MNEGNDRGLLERLRNLIGRDCDYLGRRCRLIEVLADEGILVLEVRERLPPIQTDQYGQAVYRANDLMQVPIFDRNGSLFSDEIMDLFNNLNRRSDGTDPGRA